MDYIIKTTSLTKKFGEKKSVDSANINVKRGEIYGLLGRNGAGKTTIMRMLMNLTKPTSGEIELLGNKEYKNSKKVYNRIGSIIEYPGFYENLTGEENLQIFAKLRGIQRKDSVKRALEIVDLDKELKKPFVDYSMGMKQRLGIASAIMHDPELLILDEPINGLDPVGIQEIRSYLKRLCEENGTTIFLSSHILNEIEQLADTIGVIHDGKMMEEVSMATLHKRNRRYLEFKTSNENKSCLLLEEKYNIKDYSVHGDGSIRIYTDFNLRSELNKLFVKNDIDVFRINISEESLEDYFSNLIGGGKIG
ncbi:ABC transporter ATP-binding protein [Metaclostridioides mangenotii]|uniref:Bacitracin transport system ATP-binding protein n=1 Tax=Metaclostridioides mangenotii TaxID=1540 RepID=A0ABS4E7S0_9FIRM|nr:ABC transporter ATP-binding protein [Clostridioides mangenotii]MBP1853995.1 bacitracin transport system ATP-binding protein [Clostridioides mangenotii]